VTPGTDTAGFTPNGELSASKSATLPATIAAGQSISYTVTLENTGNVTVNGAAPSDSGPTFNGATAANNLSSFAPASANFSPGTSQAFTATYVLAQADVDAIAAATDPANAIDNTAGATGTPVGGSPLTSVPDTLETGAAPTGGLTVTKSSTLPATLAAGQVITYAVTVQNTGNVTVTNATPDDSGPTFN